MEWWFVLLVLFFWIVGILTAPEMMPIYAWLAILTIGAVLVWAGSCYVFIRLPRERRNREEAERNRNRR